MGQLKRSRITGSIMKERRIFLLPFGLFIFCFVIAVSASAQLGTFSKDRDLFLAHFDLKTDVDDAHSIAAVATVLADPRFSEVSFHAVAGAYGAQGGFYVPANELFKLAFGSRWSDRHADPAKAVREVSQSAIQALNSGGTLWIAEGGQSDFSAALVRSLQKQLPDIDLKNRIHIVQHSAWNEKTTTPEDLEFVKKETTYHKIPDGNVGGNGTPNFTHNTADDWRNRITDPHLISIWEMATEIANRHNGVDGRYLNKTIKNGGLDFSDAVETAWIFGFADMEGAHDFFARFSTKEPNAAK